MKRLTITAAVVAFMLGSSAYAQAPGDIFNGAPSMIPGTNAAEGALNQAGADPGNFKAGDFTEDEKRMQHKYRDSIKHAKSLITKGTAMMDSGKKSGNDKDFKKGKILKEIGERQLGELNANNPFPPSSPTPEPEPGLGEMPTQPNTKEVAEAKTPGAKPEKKEKKSRFGLPKFGKKKKDAPAATEPESQTTNDQ